MRVIVSTFSQNLALTCKVGITTIHQILFHYCSSPLSYIWRTSLYFSALLQFNEATALAICSLTQRAAEYQQAFSLSFFKPAWLTKEVSCS